MACPRCMNGSGLCEQCEAFLYPEQTEETPVEQPCGAKDGRRARNGGYSAACVKPKGHDGKHEDCYGCWWV